MESQVRIKVKIKVMRPTPYDKATLALALESSICPNDRSHEMKMPLAGEEKRLTLHRQQMLEVSFPKPTMLFWNSDTK